MKSGIYSITNVINKKIYIGSAVDIKKRWRDHRFCFKRKIHHNLHLQSAWNKYGELNFNFEIIEYCSLKVLRNREKCFIDLHKSKDSQFGYNVNDPKIIFRNKTKESTKQKLSKKMLGDKNPMYGKFGINHPKYNYILSDESHKNLSRKRTTFIGEKSANVKLTNNQVLEIREKYIPRIYTTTKLAKEYNVSQGTIMSIIKRRGWTHI